MSDSNMDQNDKSVLISKTKKKQGTSGDQDLLQAAVQAQTLSNASPPTGKTHPFSKIALTLKPVMQFICPSRFRFS